MELGCDVLSEKPMTTDAAKARAVFDTIARRPKNPRDVNLRYINTHRNARADQERRDRPTARGGSAWTLDTRHGADYFRRCMRKRRTAAAAGAQGTHHFDMVNWWIDSYPKQSSPWAI